MVNYHSKKIQSYLKMSLVSFTNTSKYTCKLCNHDLSHDKHLLRAGHNHKDHDKELITLIKNEYNMNADYVIIDKAQLCETFFIQLNSTKSGLGRHST